MAAGVDELVWLRVVLSLNATPTRVVRSGAEASRKFE